MKKHFPTPLRFAQRGFTIIELMIATLVFSVILIVITLGVLHFTNAYYGGVNNSTTQSTARSVIDSIAQAVQFGGGDFISKPPTTYCVGNQQYDFVLGKVVGAGGTIDALYKSPHTGSGCNPIAGSLITGSVSGGQELLGEHMRLSNLVVSKISSNLYRITVRIVYGDDILLNNPSATNATCKGQTGSQFCSVSELSTTVQSRIGG